MSIAWTMEWWATLKAAAQFWCNAGDCQFSGSMWNDVVNGHKSSAFVLRAGKTVSCAIVDIQWEDTYVIQQFHLLAVDSRIPLALPMIIADCALAQMEKNDHSRALNAEMHSTCCVSCILCLLFVQWSPATHRPPRLRCKGGCARDWCGHIVK